METFAVAATQAVATPPSVDLAQAAFASPDEVRVRRWPGWMRLAILLGGSIALWALIGWAAFRVLGLS